MADKGPRLTYGGRLVGTIAAVAEAAGMETEAARKALKRAGVQPIDPPPVDQRSPLYYVTDALRVLRERPGKGRRTRPVG